MSSCQCETCKRDAKFSDILSRYEFSEEDQQFLKDYQNYYINESFDKYVAKAKEESLIDVLKILKNLGIFTAEHYWYIFHAKKVVNESLFLPENFWDCLK